ncbi:hypothetical protein KGF57_000014 [Candida theae]|uniref:MARVEL domain-containing protein n=1 Tax=Candida theae TaxID=1198502 RepID=A0AAD5BJW0_9ASCO|nr:uncharacterized protein KGF57_000014 [Candida theae]KAI5968899.1 hypothetical protein KGF57_000014 [Candida theae]
MAITRKTVSIILRSAEFLFSVVVLGLSAGVLAGYNSNIPSVTLNLVVAILDIIWLAYVAFIAPSVFAGQTPTVLVLTCQVILWALYLAAWVAVTADFPKNCNESIYMRDSIDTCRANQAILAFSILNYVVLNTELAVFYQHSLIPEAKTFGGRHLLQKTTYVWGTLFNADTASSVKSCTGFSTGVDANKDRDYNSHRVDEESTVGNQVNDEKT